MSKKVVQSDVGLKEVPKKQKTISVFEVAEYAQKSILLREYDTKIRKKMNDLFNAYAEIGFLLHKINEEQLYELNGNKSIYEYAKEQYDLAPTTVKNVIAVSQRFFESNDYNQIELRKEFDGFGFSQLVELMSVPDEKIKDYTPSMSVRKIRKLKALENTDTAVKELISTNSELVDFTNYILNYAYQDKHNLEVKIEAFSNLGKNASEISSYAWNTDMNYLLNVTFKIGVTKPKKSDTSFQIDIDAKGLKISTNSRNISQVDLYATNMDDLTNWFGQFMEKVEKHVTSLIPKLDEVTGQVILPEDRKYQKVEDAYSYLENRTEDYIRADDVIKLAVKRHFKNLYYDADNNNLKLYTSHERNRKNKPKFEIQNIYSPSSTVVVIYDDNGEVKEKRPLMDDYKEYVRVKAEELLKSLEVES